MGLFGRLVERLRRRLGESPIEDSSRAFDRLLAAVEARGEVAASSSDAELAAPARRIAGRVRAGGDIAAELPEWYAIVREVGARRVGLRAHDEQVLAGIVLAGRRVVEMPTGEGKTLAAVFPVSLSALSGRGVHVLTFNDYLARRDAEWMGPIYEALGLSVGVVQQGMDVGQRRIAYGADVTYATAKEVGFDVLRDGLAVDPSQLVHRPFHHAIFDEADSILIDEARVPLVIARSTGEEAIDPRRAARLVGELRSEEHYHVGKHRRAVTFAEAGIDLLERRLGRGNLYDPANQPLLASIHLALRAGVLLRRDVHYLVREGRIELVDDFTGRVVPDRRWPDGLQAAVEAKEDVEVRPEGRIHGSITIQHLAALYPGLGAMTATACPAAEEFEAIYGLETFLVPPHRTSIRSDETDLVFTHLEAQHVAVVDAIDAARRSWRPVLVGTRTVVESEALGRLLDRRGIPHRILNARNDREEAEIVARAGTAGAVTISTNMAGRGTDIRLGGPDEFDRDRVAAFGGLAVLGTSRHESRRIDDQLRGRAGRQGDPGSSRFLVSLEDDLLVRYGIVEMLGPDAIPARRDAPLDDPFVGRKIEHAQRIIEGEHFQVRRTLWRYTGPIEAQRRAFQEERRAILLDPELDPARRGAILDRMDERWAEHLTGVEALKDQVPLSSAAVVGPFMANIDPYLEFQVAAGRAFEEMMARLEVEAAELARAEPAAPAPDSPSSTWTYLLAENPFGNWLDRTLANLFGALRRQLGVPGEGS